MKPKETITALRKDRDNWKLVAEHRGDIITALRAELASLQDSYHLLNAAVAKVLRARDNAKGGKR